MQRGVACGAGSAPKAPEKEQSSEEHLRVLAEAADGAAAAVEVGAAQGGAKHSMEVVCEVVQEAAHLEVDERLRVQLRDAALAALAWETTASVLLDFKQCVL